MISICIKLNFFATKLQNRVEYLLKLANSLLYEIENITMYAIDIIEKIRFSTSLLNYVDCRN